MEDILASIRRILNDDDETASAPHGAPPEANPAEDVFELDRSMIIDEHPEPAHTPEPTEAETPPPAQFRAVARGS